MILSLLLGLAAAGAAPQPTIDATPQAGGYAVSVTSVLIRRTPTLPGPVIDEEKSQTLFKVLSCSNGWCALDLGRKGGVGYLPVDALLAVPPPS